MLSNVKVTEFLVKFVVKLLAAFFMSTDTLTLTLYVTLSVISYHVTQWVKPKTFISFL